MRFIDPDGREIVDANGDKVTYTSKGWSSNVTPDIKTIGNAMLATPKGREMLQKMLFSENKIKLNIDSGKGDGKAVGKTDSYKSGDNIGDVNIVIFKGLIQDNFDNLIQTKAELEKGGKLTNTPTLKQQSFLDNMPTSISEVIAATAAHEAEHATNKSANSHFEIDSEKCEDIANQTQIEVIKQTPENRPIERIEPKQATGVDPK